MTERWSVGQLWPIADYLHNKRTMADCYIPHCNPQFDVMCWLWTDYALLEFFVISLCCCQYLKFFIFFFFSSQSLVNLLVVGRAVTNVFDMDKDLGGISE